MSDWVLPHVGTRPLAILGGGVLGRRIATVWVAGGYNVNIRDPSSAQRTAAIEYVTANARDFGRRYGTNKEPGRIQAFEDLATTVRDAWLVIEAVPEKLALKIATLGELDRLVPADCIIGTNSSSYKSSELVGEVDPKRRNRVCNTHYYMPPDMNIIELMTCGYTDPIIFPFLAEHHKAVGLMPVVARKESTGFVVNRVWAAIKRECLMVLSEGVSDPSEIDAIWKEMFAKITPCALMDRVGLDTVMFIEEHYVKERHLGTTIVDWLRTEYVDQGKLGAKSENGGLFAPDHATQNGQLAAPKIYVLDLGALKGKKSGRILVGDSNGRELETIVDHQSYPDGIDISLPLGRIYWTNMGAGNANDGSVMSAKLDGTDVQTLISDGKLYPVRSLRFHLTTACRSSPHSQTTDNRS